MHVNVRKVAGFEDNRDGVFLRCIPLHIHFKLLGYAHTPGKILITRKGEQAEEYAEHDNNFIRNQLAEK